MECVDSFLQLEDFERMETDGYVEATGQVSAAPQAANNSNSWTSTGTMVQEYHVQSPPRQPHLAQQQHASAEQSLDMLFEMDGVDDLPRSSQPHLMPHGDLDLLPDVPPVGVDLDSLHLHALPQHTQHMLSPQPPATQQHAWPLEQKQEASHSQQHRQQQQAWASPSWHSHSQPQQAAWMPVPAPPVQYSSSWSGGPHAVPQPFAGTQMPGSAPFAMQHQQQQQVGSQPSAGHWGAQQLHHHAVHGQQLSASVPVAWGSGGHLAHSQQAYQQPVPLMYDFGAASQQPGSQQPLPSPGCTPRGLAQPNVPGSATLQQRAHTAPPPRRSSARLPARINYSVFAGELDTSDSEEEEDLSDGSARSSPIGTPRAGGGGGSSASPADSGSPPMGQLLLHQGSGSLRPSSYSAGGSGRFGSGRYAATPPQGGAAPLGTPKSLPAGNGFPKSRSGRTVRPSGRSLRDASPDAAFPTGGRERERGAAASALLGRPGSGTLSKRKRLVQPPAALRDGADADFNQRRKQHNPWTREETEALVDGVEHCGGAGHWQDIKRLGYPAIASRSAVDLKDKWRNLLRIAELPPELAAARVDKKREAPSMEILERVRTLTLAGQQRAAAGEARAAAATSRSRARGRRS